MAYLTLDLQYFAEEKTEKATPRKREESRKKGQVAKSSDMNTAFSLFLMFLFLLLGSSYLSKQLSGVMKQILGNELLINLSEGNLHHFLTQLTIEVAKLLVPVLLAGLSAAVIPNVMQIGFMFTSGSIQIKLDRLDPLKGLKRIYSIRAVVEFLKSLLKILCVGIIVFTILWMNKDQLLILPEKGIGAGVLVIGKITMQMGLSASIFLIVLGVMDYLYQRFDFEKDIRMSKQELKDEFKKNEGDPQIKGKIRERQRQMAMRRMMQQVPKADVVITNPTHFAVALHYENGKMDAPIVVAKGAGFVALKIKEIAQKNGVIMVENRPLARKLYHELEVGEAIPEALFHAVAEVLAYVYRLKKKVK